MYFVRSPRRPGLQPEGPLQIDFSNPLSKGLLDGLDWKYRRYIWDGRYMDNTGAISSPYYRQQTRLGQGSALYAGNNPLRPQLGGRFTAGSITLLHVGVVAAGATAQVSGAVGHTNGSANVVIRSSDGTTAGKITAQVYTGATQTVGGSVTLPVGDVYIGVVRSDRRAAKQELWLNGVPDPVTTSSSGSLLNSTYFGNANTATATPSLLTLVWDRALTDDEMFRVSRDPWEVVSPARRIWVPVSAAAPGSYTLTAAAGSFSLTGNAAGLRADRKLTAAAGSFSLTGNAAGLYRGLKLTAAAGSFAWTGNAASLVTARSLVAAAGAYVQTGNAAALRINRILAAASGSYTFTGNDASLVHSAPGSYSIAANAGAYSFTGNAAALRADRRLTAAAGVFNLTGSVAQLLRGYRLAATVQTFALTGQAATLTYSGATATVRYASRSRLFVTGRELRAISTQRTLRSIQP